MLLIQLDTVTSCISAISSQVCFFIKSNHLNIDVCRGGRTSRVLHTPVSQKRNLGKGTVYQWFSNQNSEACKDGGIQASGCLPVQNEIGVWFKEGWCGFVFCCCFILFYLHQHMTPHSHKNGASQSCVGGTKCRQRHTLLRRRMLTHVIAFCNM